ncbi:tetratricopeptide repeat protein [Sandaracinus amylolyticus]|uniref:tetratricopeptide repeat protein n=1 Tax=Sandaracinus amylolyticus TaxID=927083 RepID=UPI003AF3335E
MIASARGNVHAALDALDRAVAIDADLFEARMVRGALLLSARAHEDAERDHRRAVELRPAAYEAWLGLGVSLRGAQRIEEARAAYERAIEIAPERPEAYYDLGILYDDFGSGSEADARRAVHLYRRFLGLARGRADLHAAIADVSAECGCGDLFAARGAIRRSVSQRCRRPSRVTPDGCIRGRIERAECNVVLQPELACMQLEAERMAREIEEAARQREQSPRVE